MSNIVSLESPLKTLATILISALFLSVLVLPNALSADDKKEERKRELQKTGTLASARGGSGYEGVNVGVWGQDDKDLYSEAAAPITGSVSQLNKREWVVKVFNNSEDRYSITLRVDEMNKAGKKIDYSTYSAVLAGGEKWERKFNARENTKQAELQLTSWKNLDEKKRKAEEAKKKAEEEAKAAKGK